jgi:hypothetical protein
LLGEDLSETKRERSPTKDLRAAHPARDGAGSLDELVRTYYARPRSKRPGLLAAIKRTSPDVDRTWRDPEWEFASPVD